LIRDSVYEVDVKLLDHRYFYPDKNRVTCACGFARDAAEILLRNANLDRFLSLEYINSMLLFSGDPGVLGSMVEQTCLAAITRFGLNCAGVDIKLTEMRGYYGSLIQEMGNLGPECSTLFVPNRPRNQHIDALYVRKTTRPVGFVNTAYVFTPEALLVPIQITISPRKNHTDSEAGFYADWATWQKKFEGYSLSSVFIWIVESEDGWEQEEARTRQVRDRLQIVSPEHGQGVVPIRTLHSKLGTTLTRCRSLAAQEHIATF
jgi:hypothetical protein